MSQDIVDVWDGVQNTNSWVHDGDVERSAVDIVELASSVAGYSAGAQAAADAASGYANTASAAVASIGTAATDAVAAVQSAGNAEINDLYSAADAETSAMVAVGSSWINTLTSSGGIVTSAVTSAGAAQLLAITSAGGVQVALVSAAGGSAIGDLAAFTAAQSAALVSAGGYQSGLIATAGSAQIAAVQAEGGTQIAAVQLAASAQVNSATVAAMSAGAAASTAQGAASAASGYAVSAGGFASVTSGYMVSAGGYATSAGGYATSAGSAASAASGYALTASGYMISAGGYASAASDSADAAAASAVSIAGEVEQIGINTKNISTIQSLLNGALSTTQTDSTTAYAKTVPAGSQPYSAIESIGGKTVVWNQLCFNGTPPVTVPSGITYTISGTDVTVSGTATGASVCFVNGQNATPFAEGHKYLMYGAPSGSSNQTYFLRLHFDSYVAEDTGSGVIWTATGSGLKSGVAIFVVSGTAISTAVKFSPHLVDLTLMFGAGNEPSTVSEFRAMFPTIDPAYDAGSLKSAAVTGAVSVGRNLFDFNAYKTAISSLQTQATRGTVTFGNDTVTLVATGNDAYTDYVSNTYKVYTKPSTTYTFTVTYNGTGNGSFFVFQYRSDGTGITNSYVVFGENGTQSKTISFGAETAFVKMRFGVATSGNSATFSNIQVEEGSTATPYTPYMTSTLPIPAAVQQLPGYGWSAGTAYNEVDWERKVYVQRVGSVDLGTLSWGYNSSYGFYGNPSGFPAPPKFPSDLLIAANILCQKYPTTYVNAIVAGVKKNVIGLGGSYLYVGDTSYTSAADFKTAMSGVMLYYELATPVETDISSLLSDDNLIEVEPGGTLTFENQLGDDYRIPVPSDVEYTIDMAPDTPSTDGTYTLQCTVTDGVATYSWVSA